MDAMVPAVSKLWSCGTLDEGFQHVQNASAHLDEMALARELQDSCLICIILSIPCELFYLCMIPRTWKTFCDRMLPEPSIKATQ